MICLYWILTLKVTVKLLDAFMEPVGTKRIWVALLSVPEPLSVG